MKKLVFIFCIAMCLLEALGFIPCLLIENDVGVSLAVSDPVSALIGAGAGILSSIFGGLFGSSENDSTNRMNLQIARETNEQNYRMFQEQLAYQDEMFNKVNVYNTPSAQKQRLRDAGLNPNLMLQGGNAGVASAISSPSPNPAVTATMRPFDYSPMMQGIERSLNSYFENAGREEQTNAMRIDNLTRMDENIARIEKLRAEKYNLYSSGNKNEADRNRLWKEIESMDENLQYLRSIRDDMRKSWQLDNTLKDYEGQKMYEEKESARLQKEYQKTLNAYLPKMQQAQIDSFRASTASAYADAGLKRNMSKTEKEKCAREITERQIAELRKEHLPVTQRLEDRLLRANRIQIDAVTEKTRASNNWVQNYSPLAGFTAGGAALLKLAK